METAVMIQLQTAVLEKSAALYKVAATAPVLLYTLLLVCCLIWRCSEVDVYVLWRCWS